MSLPKPVGGSIEIHPDGFSGLACMNDGSLVIFRFPDKTCCGTLSSSLYDSQGKDKNDLNQNVGEKVKEDERRFQSSLNHDNYSMANLVYLVPPPLVGKKHHHVTCATFGKKGDIVYAATKCGTFFGFKISQSLQTLLHQRISTTSAHSKTTSPKTDNAPFDCSYHNIQVDCEPTLPSFCIKIPGGAQVWQMVISRDGKMILTNSADSSLRLYHTHECWDSSPQKEINSKKGKSKSKHGVDLWPKPSTAVKPRYTYLDVVSKAPWACCDFSGDSEYVVGGCNAEEAGNCSKYELYLWNTSTGALVDQLTGPQVSIYSLSWHPTRSFIACGTSDGLVDIWGPRMDWTAFAPDFQALPRNIEYIETEDEFDTLIDGNEEESAKRQEMENKLEEQEFVDLLEIAKISAFESDSESETDVFCFPTKMCTNMI
eukprot:CAMPEP_0184868020 /NCGR_PEP_ID=MMETSP0580-20130426/28781_1 /TAXON_ID=1118495 /ORGANISM="Dactyliosolen fragilissimus" /LENGTH=427 /DNA_ID=CAMNT_0027368629 /DNA_START=155 /DNA_END=1435 /DNA_ORIENTATION=-